jgi:hypothetical protein
MLEGINPIIEGGPNKGGMGGVGSLRFSMYQRYGKQASKACDKGTTIQY